MERRVACGIVELRPQERMVQIKRAAAARAEADHRMQTDRTVLTDAMWARIEDMLPG